MRHSAMPSDLESELREASERILRSSSRKRLIVAGPGTGKTHIFRQLLELAPGDRKTRLVLTFINNLRNDLAENLSELASVYTLHASCQSLLYRKPPLRSGLSGAFTCLPGLASLIKADWEVLRGGAVPRFVELMRTLHEGDELTFYIKRGNYYDAVDFDDSVFRVWQGLSRRIGDLDTFDLVLVDEFQDFNGLEAGLIDLIAEDNPIVIAGDDDQALYAQLRGSSWEFIRSLHNGGEYEVFNLPFCLRCPEVIVHAVNDIIERAKSISRLDGRIDKPYRPYTPLKGPDSQRYPHIGLVATTVQSSKANYMGRYIAQVAGRMPEGEVKEASEKGFSPILVIAANPYRRQIVEFLDGQGMAVDTKRDTQPTLTREAGLVILSENPESNLGWRIVLEFEDEELRAESIRTAAERDLRLVETLSPEFRERVMDEARTVSAGLEENVQELQAEQKLEVPLIRVTSFEGAKGLSAQHVFIAGLHEGEIPRDASEIDDLEICRFIVGLTRARKKCYLLYTNRFAGQPRTPSPFLSWIEESRYEFTRVDARYWKAMES